MDGNPGCALALGRVHKTQLDAAQIKTTKLRKKKPLVYHLEASAARHLCFVSFRLREALPVSTYPLILVNLPPWQYQHSEIFI